MAEYEPVELSQKTVKDMVFSCLDFKFLHAFDAVSKQDIADKADGPRWPAPSKLLASGGGNEMLTMIHGLHKFNTLHVQDHTFCGGFMEDYSDPEDEDSMVEVHLPVQERAVQMARDVLPHLTVVTYVVGTEKVLHRQVHTND